MGVCVSPSALVRVWAHLLSSLHANDTQVPPPPRHSEDSGGPVHLTGSPGRAEQLKTLVLFESSLTAAASEASDQSEALVSSSQTLFFCFGAEVSPTRFLKTSSLKKTGFKLLTSDSVYVSNQTAAPRQENKCWIKKTRNKT